jgi:hypothetical protein
VFGREVVETEGRVLVFLQALASFGVLQLVVAQEPIIRFEGVWLGGRQVDVVKQLLGPALQTLGQFIQDIGRFVHPATLLFHAGLKLLL